MKCNNCGFEFDEGIFCPECGTKFENEQVAEQKEEIPKEDKADQEKVDHIFEDVFIEQSVQENTFPSEHEPQKIDQVDATSSVNTSIEPKNQSVMGIVSFVIGILSLLCIGGFIVPEIVGIVLGSKAKKEVESKTGLAKAGFILNIVSLAFWVLVYAALLI